MSQWVKYLVNLRQTPEERRRKYALVRFLGGNRSHAERLRDWRWNKIARRFGYQDFNHMAKELSTFLDIGVEDDKKT